MKREGNTRETEKLYIGLDVHKHYITVGGMNAEQEIVLRPRDGKWNGSKGGRKVICERAMK